MTRGNSFHGTTFTALPRSGNRPSKTTKRHVAGFSKCKSSAMKRELRLNAQQEGSETSIHDYVSYCARNWGIRTIVVAVKCAQYQSCCLHRCALRGPSFLRSTLATALYVCAGPQVLSSERAVASYKKLASITIVFYFGASAVIYPIEISKRTARHLLFCFHIPAVVLCMLQLPVSASYTAI